MRVTLTELAWEDWRNIRRYLRRQFGRRVEMEVAGRLKAARIAIAENPGRGHRIESPVFPDLRGIVVKKSLICYRVLPTEIQIVRILDVPQDTPQGFVISQHQVDGKPGWSEGFVTLQPGEE